MSQVPFTLKSLIHNIGEVIQQARTQVRQAVNHAMVVSYWEIGRLIVDDEQQGKARAAYGKQQLQYLSIQLTENFGKGFDVRNLRNMRQFYLAYPIRNALRTELSWTHYRSLIRIDNKTRQIKQSMMQELLTGKTKLVS